MKSKDMLRHLGVVVCLRLIFDNENQVEPRKDSYWKIDVVTHVAMRLITTQGGICRSQNRAASVESSNDSAFGYTARLLFESLMYCDPVFGTPLAHLLNSSHSLL